MPATRREFLKQAAAGTLATAAIAVSPGSTKADAEKRPSMIVDTHQHLWDPNGLHPPWLARAPEVLRRNYGTREYLYYVALAYGIARLLTARRLWGDAEVPGPEPAASMR